MAIELGYTIKRDERDKEVEYKCPITSLSNLAYVEGPNSSGKSTILNVIALAMQGAHKSSSVKPEIKQEISKLITSEHQTLEFNVRIDSKGNGIGLVGSLEPGKDIRTYEIIDGKETFLQGPAFSEKYNLIYEIPSNPLKKLDNMLETLYRLSVLYGNKAVSLDDYIENILLELEKDPRKMLPEYEKKAEEYGSTANSESKKAEASDAVLIDLKKYAYAKILSECFAAFNSEEKRVKKLEKNQKELDKTVPRSYGDLEDVRAQLTDIHTKFREAGKIIKPILKDKKYKNYLDLWNRIGFDRVIKDQELDPSLDSLLETVMGAVEKERTKVAEKDDYKECEVMQALIDALEQFRGSNIKVPESGLEISEYISKLKSNMESRKPKLVVVQNANDAIPLLSELSRLVAVFNRVWIPKLKNAQETIEGPKDDQEDHTDEINRLSREIKKLKNDINLYKGKCIELGMNVDNIDRELRKIYDHDCQIVEEYESYTDEQLLESIKDLESRAKDSRKLAERNRTLEDDYKKKIEDAKAGKPHELADYADQLHSIHKAVRKARITIDNDLSRTIDMLRNRDQSGIQHDNICVKIHSAISSYMAQTLKSIMYNKETYQVTSLDFLSGKVETKEGKTIRLADLGTGQGQGLYINGLLKSSDSRKIILLLDEVAMMDPNTLQSIFNTINELYKEGKLIAAIVVQMGLKLKCRSIEEA